jgi:signal transduction histidine kinase/ligand-binding sensor domain-containing protein
MFVDRDGTLSVASENTIVFLPAGTRRFHPTGTHVGQVMQIAEATNGKLWMAETTRSVHPFPLKTGQRPSDDTEVRVGSVAILFDRDGALWITTLGDGMRRAPVPETLGGKIGEFSSEVESFTTKDGLSDDSINAILEDREGNIWVGTHKGLDRFRKTNLVPIALTFSAAQAVLAPGDNGDVWLYSDGHMIRIHGGRGYEVTALDRFRDALGSSYRGSDGITWWIGMHGIYRFGAGRFSKLPLPQELSMPYSNRIYVTEDHSQELWAAAGHDGLFRLKNEKWTKLNASPEVGKSHSAAAFTDWMGRVWFGYEGGTIVILNGATVEKVVSPQASPVGGIRAIAGGDGHVWVGGDLGLASFQGDRFHPVAPVDDIRFRTVWGILETSGGDLWLCENRGVIHITSAEVYKALGSPDYRVKYDLFDTFDGLPGTFRDAGKWSKAIQTPDGQIWFAASNGLARLDAAKIFRNALPPPVSIRSFLARGKTYWPTGRHVLPPDIANLQIDYTALSLSVPERVLFRYKLEGSDETWVEAQNRRQAFYTNLGPGRYRFRVTARNNDGVWNEAGTFLDFSIAPAYYQTNWFRALCAAAFLALLWAVYCLRVRQLRQKFAIGLEARVNERTRIARELHDTLLQSLHGVMFQFQAVRNLLPKRPQDAIQALDGAINRTEQAIAESRSAIQGLRYEPAGQTDLAESLTAIAQDLAAKDADGGSANFRVIMEGERRTLSPPLQEEVGQIARELLRNAFQHALAHEVEAEIHYDDRLFRLRIRDDGKGMDQTVMEQGGRPGHWGLTGVRERAQRIGAQLDFWSEAGAGTEVQLTVPAAIAYKTSRADDGLSLFRKAKS